IRILGARILDIVGSVIATENRASNGFFQLPEKHKSLINETNIELNPKQGNQEAEQIISDGDKAFPKLNREQAIQEAEQIISDGDKADPELNGEVIIQPKNSKTGPTQISPLSLYSGGLYHFTNTFTVKLRICFITI
ncbi:hypothetical protein Tco_1115323, partial [Tanacetum coccineum]